MRAIIFILVVFPCFARADDARVQFYADPTLVESGLIKHIRPRFSLKTQVGVDMVGNPEAADLTLAGQGQPVFTGLGQTWHVEVQTDHAGAARFRDWLVSDIGTRTIFAFAPEGVALFSAPEEEARVEAPVAQTDDAVRGREVAFAICGRCHVTETERRMAGIGSSPSFAVLRSLEDWDYRFSAFYVLNPHPSFTQIDDVTEPFLAHRPPPITPIVLTMEELEAILAYVETIAPADLGEPLALQ